MKKTFFILFTTLLMTIGFANALSAQDFYVLIATDSITDIKETTAKDLLNISQEVIKISDETGMKLHLSEISGDKLSYLNIKHWIEKVPAKSNDVIFFYFSGHGFRTKKAESIWPFVLLPTTGEALDVQHIISLIKEKPARLSIVFCDCCNNMVQNFNNLIKPRIKGFRSLKTADSQGYRKLFVDTKGLIIATGSKPGDYAWASSRGGIFTNAFLSFLRREVQEPDADWKRLFENTEKYCQTLQIPQFLISVRKFSKDHKIFRKKKHHRYRNHHRRHRYHLPGRIKNK